MMQPYISINPDLFTKNAGATLSIDLGAIIKNYDLLNNKTKMARCGAVVKANAYGLGMLPVARALQKTECKDFFVAYLDEGIALRSILGNEYAIYVLNGFYPYDAKTFINYNLIPVLNDLKQVKLWIQTCKEANFNYPAALQFDTGMSRFGIDINDLRIIQDESISPFIPTLTISHLACADDPNHSLNLIQLQRFKAFIHHFPSVPASLSASSGIFLGENWHFDLTRPGAALYGINPVPGHKNPMYPVVTLRSKILQLREIPKGATVGYGATFTADKALKLAIVSTGYADGFFRSLSNKICVKHIDHPDIPLPVIGRISMDCLCINISPLANKKVMIDDEIEIIGLNCPIETIANAANTIGYEILTALGNRYRRIYN
ncbi:MULTISPECIES: alanine racemase [unclassified Commensalibacter]|uniref:alanine racemase n=1 Tax=unclassified Commensalibacter TaxID=2630218 RepID=UPI0018DB417A|nr:MULTISPECIES: alanine racemase [unclassified Commensalibacter]MBH9969017.1 alanine racemase [Commensalibacter sp. M0265]MBH9976373.1 alanine racemase [Commensalibacter sp. M0266]MBH9992691.1 alanine racemase [Commensalibacter sp. M0270]MBI0045549.1 alanine racemase [Commensalibacter sp. M0267]MBI0055218.1 alanine racemase [Commensalibacter sp. M0268]